MGRSGTEATDARGDMWNLNLTSRRITGFLIVLYFMSTTDGSDDRETERDNRDRGVEPRQPPYAADRVNDPGDEAWQDDIPERDMVIKQDDGKLVAYDPEDQQNLYMFLDPEGVVDPHEWE